MVPAAGNGAAKPAGAATATAQPAKVLAYFHAVGAQVYTCAKTAGTESYAWTLQKPDATLFDQKGEAVGTHGAGPTWTLKDGSSVVAKKVAQADAPAADAVLILAARRQDRPRSAVEGDHAPGRYRERQSPRQVRRQPGWQGSLFSTTAPNITSTAAEARRRGRRRSVSNEGDGQVPGVDGGHRQRELGQILVAEFAQRLKVERVRDVVRADPRDGLGPVERHPLARREERRLAPDDQPVDPRVGLARGAQRLGVHVDAEGAGVDLGDAQVDQLASLASSPDPRTWACTADSVR